MNGGHILLGVLRLSMGWIFLWPFLDKLIGFGFTTTPDKAWVAGGSPTEGFLAFATQGPFAVFYQNLAGSAFVDWLFMIGLLGIGLALLLGVLTRIASYSGAVMLVLMWTAVLPPEHNPFLDDHIVYALLLLLLAHMHAGDYLGFGKTWKKQPIVKRYSVLE